MPPQNRMMTLIACLQAQNCSNLPGSWRHPSTMLDFLTPEYYQRIARTLEDGKIQMAFFDDRLALPDLYMGHHADAVAAGVRAVEMDPAKPRCIGSTMSAGTFGRAGRPAYRGRHRGIQC